QARLLARLAQRRALDAFLAVDVAAELQPLAELPVPREQARAAVGRQDPRRRRDVPGHAAAQQAVIVRRDEREEARRDLCRVRAGRRVALQQPGQEAPVHASTICSSRAKSTLPFWLCGSAANTRTTAGTM